MFNVLFVICFVPVACAQEPPKAPQGWASSQVPALPVMKGKLEGLCGSQGMETSWWTTEPQGRGRHSGGLHAVPALLLAGAPRRIPGGRSNHWRVAGE